MTKLKLSSDRKTTTLARHEKSTNRWKPKVKNAFGLPAGTSCPGSTEWCFSKTGGKCYAFNLERAWSSVDRLVNHNFDLLKSCGNNVQKMVTLLTELVTSVKWYDTEKVFRWHWDGDIFSKTYAIALAKTCANFPDVQFWLYTRSFDYVSKVVDIPNLTVYLSVDRFNIDKATDTYHAYPEGTLWIAACADTWNESEDIMRQVTGRNAPRCPELTGKTPLVTPEGKGACVECGLCIYGRNHVRFASGK